MFHTGRLDTATYYPKTINNVVVTNKLATTLDVKLLRKTTGTNNTFIVTSTPFSVYSWGHGIKIVLKDSKAPGRIKISIYGVNGKLVKDVPVTGDNVLWDGKDQGGNRVPGGCYIVKAATDNGTHIRNFVFSR